MRIVNNHLIIDLKEEKNPLLIINAIRHVMDQALSLGVGYPNFRKLVYSSLSGDNLIIFIPRRFKAFIVYLVKFIILNNKDQEYDYSEFEEFLLDANNPYI